MAVTLLSVICQQRQVKLSLSEHPAKQKVSSHKGRNQLLYQTTLKLSYRHGDDGILFTGAAVTKYGNKVLIYTRFSSTLPF